MMHVMEADSIHLELGSRRILSDIYLKCETGKVTGLLGRNGNGKTCLLNIIYGNMNPNSRSIRFDSTTIQHPYSRPDLLLYLPQFNFVPKTFTLKTVFSHFKLTYSLFEELFPEFKLKYKSRISDLSGGQRRLVEIYVILRSPANFVMLDEPFSHLSPLLIDAIKQLIIQEKENKGILVTDHMYRHIIDISDDIYLLLDGKTKLIKNVQEIESLGYAKL